MSQRGGPEPDHTGLARMLRVPTFALVTVALGVGAHVAADGTAPTAGTFGVLLLLVGLSWQTVARTEQSLPRLTAAVFAVQFGMHLALADGPAVGLAPAAMPGMAGMPSMPGMAGMPGDAMSPGSTALMWACHGLAAFALALWLRRGEAALWRALRRALPHLPRSFRPAVVPGRTNLPGQGHQVPPAARSRVLLLLGDRRRAPPLPA